MKTRTLKTAGAVAIFVIVMTAQSASAYYNPSTGRWLNRDPKGETGGINLYSFCAGDGINDCDYVGLYSAVYKSYSRGRIHQHESYMIFEAKCPACQKLKIKQPGPSVNINYNDIAAAIIADLQKKIADDQNASGHHDIVEIEHFLAAIKDLQTDPTHVSGEKGIINNNCDNKPIEVDVFMNSRFGGEFPLTFSQQYVTDELDTYKQTTKVTYDCEKCSPCP